MGGTIKLSLTNVYTSVAKLAARLKAGPRHYALSTPPEEVRELGIILAGASNLGLIRPEKFNQNSSNHVRNSLCAIAKAHKLFDLEVLLKNIKLNDDGEAYYYTYEHLHPSARQTRDDNWYKDSRVIAGPFDRVYGRDDP